MARHTTKCIKHGWGAVQLYSLVFLISFGHVGRDTASKTQPRFIHKRYAQCRADRVVPTRVGTFACRTFHRNTKASK